MIKLLIFFLVFAQFSFSAELTETEEAYSEIESTLNELEYEQVRLSVEKKEIESQIIDLKKKIQVRKLFLIKRLKAQSRLRGTRWGELLIRPDFNELNRNLKILSRLNTHDSGLFKEYTNALAVLKLAEKNLIDTDRTIVLTREHLVKKLDELKKLEQLKVADLLNQKSDSLLLLKGKLSRPLDRKPDIFYGQIRDESNLYFLFNRGLVFRVDQSFPVKSVGPGVLIFSDLMPDGRETLVVQHRDNYYSIYSGISLPLKKVGQSVELGEVMARTTGQEFYFEIRHYGYAINPNKWFEEKL